MCIRDRGFPWYINTLTADAIEDMDNTAFLIWFVPSDSKDKVQEMLGPVAKEYISKCAEEKMDTELVFFVSWKGCDNANIHEKFRSFASLPQTEPLLAIVDVPQQRVRKSLYTYL